MVADDIMLIKVRKKTKDRLVALKVVKRESYDAVINRLLSNVSKEDLVKAISKDIFARMKKEGKA